VRAIAILLSGLLSGAYPGQLSALAAGQPPDLAALALAVLCYALVIQLSRVIREFLQGGRSGVTTWWRSSWRAALGAEVAPLPMAALGAAIYARLGTFYFVMAGAALLASSLAVRWGAISLQRQHRSVRELALLNEVSRAIIRSELDVAALSELIYREASRVVDTSSFHLGLFVPGGDKYTLLVRVQDRVRLPPLSVDLPSGDGIVGWMRETGRALLVEDFSAEMEQLPARPRYQSERPPRSGIYVPLIAGDDVIGSISIQSYRPRAFATDDMRLLSLIADQAAVAISKARAFDEARLRAVQLQAINAVSERITAILDLDELLPSVVRLIQERFGYHPVHIFTLEDDGTLLFRASTTDAAAQERIRRLVIRVGEAIIGEAAAEGHPLLINDVATDPRYIGDDTQTRAELAVPLRFGDQTIGVLDLQSSEIGRFQDSDVFVMRTLAGQIATAIESARAFTAQREEAWTLNALLQVAENIAHAASFDELLPIVVRLPPLLLGCDRCYCLLWERDRARFTPLAAYGLTAAQRKQLIGQSFDEGSAPLLSVARHSMTPVAANGRDAPLAVSAPALAGFGAAALLVLPLTARGAMLGALVADYGPSAHHFTPREMTLYTGIANQVAGALESALLAEEAAKGARLEGELRVARDIQTALLPAAPPQIAGWDIAADWRSARLVGGDFFDFWRLPQGIGDAAGPRSREAEVFALDPVSPPADSLPLGFVIADVSDKGVPAAMFMALSRSLVRAAALDGSSPALALTRANRWITRDSESAMFVTLFYGVLQSETGHLRYCCAGHNPPLLFRASAVSHAEGQGSPLALATPGIALGVLEEVTLGESQVVVEPGDILICYSDGITEAIDNDEEPFGVARLVEVVAAHHQQSAAAVLSAINDALLAFTGGRPPFDDVTLVVIKRAPAPDTPGAGTISAGDTRYHTGIAQKH
jgi:serine phosphatase RsbU (regulator of sigma subunit)/putative methionine-R-sulfoxide reductase with GAF domain